MRDENKKKKKNTLREKKSSVKWFVFPEDDD